MTKWSYVARENTHIERAFAGQGGLRMDDHYSEVTSLYICVRLLQFPVPETVSALLLCPDFPWAETFSGR